MIVEVRPKKDDPYRVEFFADGKKIENISAGRIDRRGDVLTIQAIVTYDKGSAKSSSRSGSSGSSKKGEKSKRDISAEDIAAETVRTNSKGEAE